jgi:hypothetical protein
VSYREAAARRIASFTTDMALLHACMPHFPKNAHAAAALLTSLVDWQEYVAEHELNEADGHCWVFMTDEDWERHCGVSRGQASRIMRTFEVLGWVITRQAARPGARSKRAITWYRVDDEALEKCRAVPRATEPSVARYRAGLARGTARDSGSTPYIGKEVTTGVVTKTRRRALTATEIDAWDPPDALRAWTAETNPRITEADLANFKDHHKAKGTKILDIEATWRTWVRNSLRFGTVSAGPTRAELRRPPRSTFDDAAAAYLAGDEPAQLELGGGS